jgi:rRNA-processing protein FCF1
MGGVMRPIDQALDRRNFMIPHKIHEALRRVAYEERRSMSDIVREALEQHEAVRERMESTP